MRLYEAAVLVSGTTITASVLQSELSKWLHRSYANQTDGYVQYTLLVSMPLLLVSHVRCESMTACVLLVHTVIML
jgi:hypothetical protein